MELSTAVRRFLVVLSNTRSPNGMASLWRFYCTRRESQCAHTVLEDALTGDAAEYVRYAALRSQLDFDLVRSMAEQLKHAFVAKLPGLRWFDANRLKEIQRRFRELKVRAPLPCDICRFTPRTSREGARVQGC